MKNIFSALVFLLASQQVLAQQPFQTFDMIVTDPAGVVAAMNKLQASPTGQQSTARVILISILRMVKASLLTKYLWYILPLKKWMRTSARNALSPDWAHFSRKCRRLQQLKRKALVRYLL